MTIAARRAARGRPGDLLRSVCLHRPINGTMKRSLREIAFTPPPKAAEERFGLPETFRKDGKT
jgi:hypothetical protein